MNDAYKVQIMADGKQGGKNFRLVMELLKRTADAGKTKIEVTEANWGKLQSAIEMIDRLGGLLQECKSSLNPKRNYSLLPDVEKALKELASWRKEQGYES